MLEVFNMSATMARQGGLVQLEQSDMRLALNIAKMAKRVFSRAAIEQTQQLIKKPRAEVRQEKKWGVEFPRHIKVRPAIQRHPAMVRENQTDSCLSCQNGTTQNPQTRWRCKDKGALPPRHSQPRPGMRPVPSDDDESSGTDSVPPAYVYKYTLLTSARFLPTIACAINIIFQIC